MKLAVSVRKTYQERQYEPFSVEVSMDRESVPLTEEAVIGQLQNMATILQDAIEEIIIERTEKEK